MAITQHGRRIRVASPLGEDALILTSLDAREQVSGLFRFDCTFASEDENLDFGEVIGRGIGLELEMAQGQKRYFHGIVSRFCQSEAEATNVVYRAELVPSLWLLTRSTDCRIFQKQRVTDILQAVLDEHHIEYGLEIEGSYPEIPYCVQYRESDFAFVSRLMERAGIAYHFEHGSSGHKLVLFDSPGKVKECPGQSEVTLASQQGGATAGQVTSWVFEHELRSGAFAHTDYVYTDPSLDLSTRRISTLTVGGNDRLELFDYPGGYTSLSAGDARARLRIEAEECAARRIEGASSCYGLCPGYKFELKNHYRSSFNGSYLVTSVRHRFSQALGAASEASAYENAFQCVPSQIPFRPLPLTPEPVIHGLQTAVVVGEPGREIDVDPYGCVYLHFRWDRRSQRDASSSCRVRVSQAMAGREWGGVWVPRMGQEVLVEFEEGDPNRPMVVGRVHNAEGMPPYALPDNATQSGFKSRSSPGGGPGNYNELRFEDKKGEEEIFIRAERDMTVSVQRDYSCSAGRNGSVSMAEEMTESIGTNKKVTVGADFTEEVSGSETLSVAGTRSRSVSGDDSLSASANRTVSVGGGHTVNVSGDRKIGAATISETSSGSYSISAGGPCSVQAPSVKINADGSIEISGGSSVRITGGASVEIGAPTVKISGGTIQMSGLIQHN
jgi:type VI secretion system secreted protein VgrG